MAVIVIVYIKILLGACYHKTIYGFRNKLECLSLASLSSLVWCLGKNANLLRKPLITAVISFMIQAPGVLVGSKDRLRIMDLNIEITTIKSLF